MDRTHAGTFGKLVMPIKERHKKALYKPPLKIIAKDIFLCVLAFCCGQVSFFGLFSPLGLAYVSRFLTEGTEFYIVWAVTLLGFIIGQTQSIVDRHVLGLLFILLFNIVINHSGTRLSLVKKAGLGSLSMVLAGMFFCVINSLSRFILFSTLMEGIMAFALAIIIDRGVNVIEGSLRRKIMSNEEMISLSLILSVIIAGIADVYIGQVSLKLFLCSFIILLCGYRGGATIGGSAGILMGFVLLISGKGDLYTFCILSVCGLLCGALKDLGKIVCLISFIFGITIITFYMDKEALNEELILSILSSGAVFLLLPKKAFTFINTFSCNENALGQDEYVLRIKDMTRQRLGGFSKAFSTLSQTFSQISEKRTVMGQKEVTGFIDSLAAKTCKGCGLNTHCWETDFYNTYQTFFSIVASCEKRGNVSLNNITSEFKENCVKVKQLVDHANRNYEVYKTNLLWENRIAESRELVSEQLGAVSDIITNLSRELNFDVVFNETLEKEMRVRLDKEGINPLKVTILENKNCTYEVSVYFKQCYGRKLCANSIIPIANSVLGKKMKKEKGSCIIEKGGICVLKLIEESKMRVSCGVASISKEQGNPSGDSYSFMELKNGDYLMALSDGMGSGETASMESSATIELLEQFMESGFSKETAIKMINSVLILKSRESSFTTLDICSINLYSGIGEIIKIGGASAFIIRNENVKGIRSSTLPVGVLNNVELERTEFLLKNNDFIIMMTDGVSDVIGEFEDEWIKDMFVELGSSNPQDIAEYMLIHARKKAGDKLKDDMTVVAARVWEK